MRKDQQEDGCDGDHYGGGQPWNDSMSAEMPDERTCRRAQDKPDWIQVFNFHLSMCRKNKQNHCGDCYLFHWLCRFLLIAKFFLWACFECAVLLPDAFFEFFNEVVEQVARIGNNGDIRHFHHRRLGVFIDCNNEF